MKKVLLMITAGILIVSGCNSNKIAQESLQSRISGEMIQAAKFEAFAKKASEDGQNSTAAVFQALAKSESILASKMTTLLEELGEKPLELSPKFEIKSTQENIDETVLTLSLEASSIYPVIIDTLTSVKSEEALNMFKVAAQIKSKQSDILSNYSSQLKAATDTTQVYTFGVCGVCGNIYDMAKVDDICSICKEPKEKFIIFK